jgi:SAM-dependent methyltransferase
MYEQTGRYYAFFGPHAVVTPEEKQFFGHWTAGCRRVIDFGAGLCGPASTLAHLGLEVLAFEPSPVLAAIAMDRLNRGDDIDRSITLIEGAPETFATSFTADLILMRSVVMLLNSAERAIALRAAAKYIAPGARLILDVRTPALPWIARGTLEEERRLGSTIYRRRTRYTRGDCGATHVHWTVEAERFGLATALAEEHFDVRADTVDGLKEVLVNAGFEVEKLYSAYDINRPYSDGEEMIVAVARAS